MKVRNCLYILKVLPFMIRRLRKETRKGNKFLNILKC